MGVPEVEEALRLMKERNNADRLVPAFRHVRGHTLMSRGALLPGGFPPILPRGKHCRRGSGGYTLVEAITVTLAMGIVAMMANSFVSTWPSRFGLNRSVDEAQFLIKKARLEAIRRGVNTVVEANVAEGELLAFADVNGVPGSAEYLIYDPDPAMNSKRTDYMIGNSELGRSILAGPPAASDPVRGFTSIPSAPAERQPVLVFEPSGAPMDTGAFRLADASAENHFEVCVVTLTGKVEVLKYLRAEDSPTGPPGFFPSGKRIDGSNLWVWY